MTATSLEKRLALLEAHEAQGAPPAAPQLNPLQRLLEALVAWHLGGEDEGESIATGMARGLGYQKASDLRSALTAGANTEAATDLDARWRDAMARLFALKDTTPDCDGEAFAGTLEALHNDMPEKFRRHPFLLEAQPQGYFRAT